MKICIPSYGRPGKVNVPFPDGADVRIYVPASQYQEYRLHKNRKRLVSVSDSEDGNIAKKRNAILERNKGCWLVMIDDDFRGFRPIGGDVLSPEANYRVLLDLARLAMDAGIFFFGFNNTNDPMKYRDFTPFSFTKPFYWVLGIRENGLRFNPRLTRGEDVDYYFRHMLKHRRVLRDNRYFPDVPPIARKDSGGIGRKGLDDGRRLQKWYGEKLVRINDRGEVLGVSQPVKGA